MKIAGFDWDEGNREKCGKHVVSVEEIEFVFHHRPYIAPDLKHSDAETRYLAIGRSQAGRHIFVVFALRGDCMIRPISARYMHKKEIVAYETQIADDEKRR